MIGATLQSLLTDLKAVTGRSLRPTVGTDEQDSLKALLRQQQSMLYAAHDWLHLVAIASLPIATGQRFASLPISVNPERVIAVTVRQVGYTKPEPLDRGIGIDELSTYNSDLNETAQGIMKWDLRFISPSLRLEVWPVQPVDGAVLFIRALRPLGPLVSDDDKADLDNDLIVLTAAARLLAKVGSKDAAAVASMADSHMLKLKSNVAGGYPPLPLASPPPAYRRPHTPRAPR